MRTKEDILKDVQETDFNLEIMVEMLVDIRDNLTDIKKRMDVSL